MKISRQKNRNKRKNRRLLLESLDSRQLLAVDGFQIVLSGTGGTDLFDPSGGGGIHQGYVGGGVGGVVISTSNVPGSNNAHPIAAGDAATFGEDDGASDLTSLLLANDSDPDNTGSLAIEGVNASTAAGTVTFDASSGSVSYDPAGAFESLGVGDSATDTFSYTINDSSSGRATGQVTITINGANDAPMLASDGDITVPENQTVSVSGTVSDPDSGDTVSLVATITGTTASIGSVNDPGDGTWNWTLDDLDGPGSHDITITATDGQGATATTQLTVTVTNVGPSVAADNATVAVDEGTLATHTGTWSDVSGDTVTLHADHGTVTKNSDGTWSWQLQTTDGDDDSRLVTITATDEDGGSEATSFQLNVANVAPTATNKSFSAVGNVPITLPLSQLVTGATDPGADTIAVDSIDDSTSTGSVTVDALAGIFTYTPAPGFEGTDTFGFTIVDSDGANATATATVTVDQVVWFVDNSAAPGGDGSLTAPFDSFAPLNDDGNDLDDPGDIHLRRDW
ncbi:MAG: Ig-like domain-containing protein [Pirellulaceae bacterium]